MQWLKFDKTCLHLGVLQNSRSLSPEREFPAQTARRLIKAAAESTATRRQNSSRVGLKKLLSGWWGTIAAGNGIELGNAMEGGWRNKNEWRQGGGQRGVAWQVMMLIRKKTGQAQLLAAVENRLPGLRLRKSRVIVSSIAPIMAMREIGSDIGDEQERGKEQD